LTTKLTWFQVCVKIFEPNLFDTKVSVIMGSSVLGHTQEELKELTSKDLATLKDAARNKFLSGGCDFVIDSIKDLPNTIEQINSLLDKKFRPGKFHSHCGEYPLKKLVV
jgi:hypothetical protein